MPLVVKIGEGLILLKEDAAAALEAIYRSRDRGGISVEWLDGKSITIPELEALVEEASSHDGD